MKVAIFGATGNAGTALLRALQDTDEVTGIVGIARRAPGEAARDTDAYRDVHWEELDIGLPVLNSRGEAILTDEVARVIDGVDAVVHLAWQIQPNHHRNVLRRTNVAGTRRVIQGCLKAGVHRLVAASSVGAYSPAKGDDPRDESWPAGGIGGSHYSVDKAAQERLLDHAEAQGMSVARLRPALIFDADAASEVLRLFVGAMFPPWILRPGTVPVVPLPRGLRFQVVHGADAADAYRRVLLTGASGAFNIAADDVLGAPDLAEIVDHGRFFEINPGVVRRFVALGWKSRVVAADPGWVDMAMNVPVMNCSRARSELGWNPGRSGPQALRELLTGIADGAGHTGHKLRPRRSWPGDQLPDGSAIGRRLRRWAGRRLAGDINPRMLGVYLADHVAGATAGYGQMRLLANKCLRQNPDSELGSVLGSLADQLEEERGLIAELMDSWELPRRRWRAAASAVSHRLAWAGERLSTHAGATSPALGVLDIELLRGAVAAKIGGWQTLEDLAPRLGAPPEAFGMMVARANNQLTTLEEIHCALRQSGFFRRRDQSLPG